MSAPAPGFFRVEKQDGRWWLIDPQGQRTLSKGVCHIQYDGDRIQGTQRSPYREAVQAKYGNVEAWRESAAKRLIEWGFNSIGAWSDDRLTAVELDERSLACAPILDLGAQFVAAEGRGGQAWLHGVFPDIFDPQFESFCRRRAVERCGPRKDDRTVLGWFTDNELRWGPDWRGRDELLTMFVNRPAGSAGRAAALAVLRQRYPDLQRFNAVWKTTFASWAELEHATNFVQPLYRKALYAQNDGEESSANDADPSRAAFVADCEAFAEQVADRYFRVTRDALREADPNHLNFGCRFAYLPPKPVRAAAARYLDVISFNCYMVDPMPVVSEYAALGRPLIVGEFTFRAQDAGLPNTRGAGPKVANQTERADAFKRYVRLLAHEPAIVGYHWFQHSDQPREGRFDGENSNYGVVSETDQPYAELTAAMRTVNRLVELWHADAARLVFRDDFAGNLAGGWRWLREDASGWRVSREGLEIRVQPGNMWGGANNARNVLVRPLPYRAGQEVTLSVTVENLPTEQYEQVDLAWYYDDGHMVKLGQELVNGKLCVVMGREEADQTRTIAIIPTDAHKLRLQLTARDRTIRGRFQPAGSDAWRVAGECSLPAGGEPHASVQCYQGPKNAEHWARLTEFRVESVE